MAKPVKQQLCRKCDYQHWYSIQRMRRLKETVVRGHEASWWQTKLRESQDVMKVHKKYIAKQSLSVSKIRVHSICFVIMRREMLQDDMSCTFIKGRCPVVSARTCICTLTKRSNGKSGVCKWLIAICGRGAIARPCPPYSASVWAIALIGNAQNA